MKKVLIVVVCLLLVGSAFALESGPSNKVGYTKTTIIANAPGATTSASFGLSPEDSGGFRTPCFGIGTLTPLTLNVDHIPQTFRVIPNIS